MSLPTATAAQLDLMERFRRGQRAALARAISWVESERPGFQAILHEALGAGQRAGRIGFTGPPGAGKSTLVAETAQAYRDADQTVGIVAVDPTSPFTGGALLGDRIRMNDLATDAGIFIRSMATRGSLGGLATATGEVVDLMDAYGFDRVLVETVGVGQTELEIAGAADTVVVVLVPESGDGIQAMKAGLMEIADIFVVNKSDRPGADRLVKEINTSLGLRSGAAPTTSGHHGVQMPSGAVDSAPEDPDPTPLLWEVPVLKTVAHAGEGIPELIDVISRHRRYLDASAELVERRQQRARRRVRNVVTRDFGRRLWASEWARARLEAGLEAIRDGQTTPYGVAAQIVSEALTGRAAPGVDNP